MDELKYSKTLYESWRKNIVNKSMLYSIISLGLIGCLLFGFALLSSINESIATIGLCIGIIISLFLIFVVFRNMTNAFVIVFDNKDVAKTSKIKVSRNVVSLIKTQSDILYSYDIDLSSVDNVVEKYGYIVVSGRISVRKEGTIKSIKSKLKIPKYFEGIDRLTIILLNK